MIRLAHAALTLLLAAGADRAGTRAPSSSVRPAASWNPAASRLSEAGRKVLESLPDPASVPIPAHILNRAPGGLVQPGPVPTTAGGRDSGSARNPGACYEVQLTATADPARAEQLAQEASRILSTTTHVVSGGGLHRIRAGGCLDAASAARLRDRGRAEGFGGAFVTPVR